MGGGASSKVELPQGWRAAAGHAARVDHGRRARVTPGEVGGGDVVRVAVVGVLAQVAVLRIAELRPEDRPEASSGALSADYATRTRTCKPGGPVHGDLRPRGPKRAGRPGGLHGRRRAHHGASRSTTYRSEALVHGDTDVIVLHDDVPSCAQNIMTYLERESDRRGADAPPPPPPPPPPPWPPPPPPPPWPPYSPARGAVYGWPFARVYGWTRAASYGWSSPSSVWLDVDGSVWLAANGGRVVGHQRAHVEAQPLVRRGAVSQA